MPIPFVHLHVHSEFSLLDSLCRVPDLVKKAKELGFSALALTDHGNVDGTVRFANECAKVGIKPIVGCEAYVADDVTGRAPERYHVVVMAKTERGFQGICRGVTRSNLEGFYRKPRWAWEWLLGLEDVIVTTACTSGILSHASYDVLVRRFVERFGADFYLEVMPTAWEPERRVMARAAEMRRKYGAKILATNDVHYLQAGDAKVHEVMLALGQHGVKWDDPKRWKYSIEGLHLRTADEMLAAFKTAGVGATPAISMLDATCEASQKVLPDVVRRLEVMLPLPVQLADKDPAESLRELSSRGLKWRGIDGIAAYRERLAHELMEITTLGFAAYFLIIWDMIWWCKRNDIMVGPGRGSVGGSLVAYALGITEVDPLKYQLPFERFISPGRIDLPDIDMDFEDRYRHRIFSYLQRTYGERCVAQIRTFSSMRGRMALRDVARVFGVSQAETGAVCDQILQRSGGDARGSFTIADACETFEAPKRYKKAHPKVVEYAVALEGLARNSGIHAAGVVLSKLDLHDGGQAALVRSADGNPVVNWDKHDLEQRGLMKLDVLGLNTLTVLHETARLIESNTGTKVRWTDLELEDPKVLAEFNAGRTVGVFQFNSYGLQRFCQELGIESFRYVVDASALHRPGTLKSGLISDYTARKHGQQEIPKIHPLYDEITKDTYGIILYQEQIMYILNQLAGIGWRTADTVRKAVSKKEGLAKMEQFKQQFVDGCEKQGTIDRAAAEKIYEVIVFFGSYSFNKAHSVEYSLLSYWTMWAKVYHPAEFMAASLNYGSDDKAVVYSQEARRLGLQITLPSVERSGSNWAIGEGGKELVAGLSTIKGVSSIGAQALVEARTSAGGRFGSWGGMLKAIDRRRCNKRVLEVLLRSGALLEFGMRPSMPDSAWSEALRTSKVPVHPEESRSDMLDRIADLLEFPPDADLMRRYRNILAKATEWWGVRPLAAVDEGKTVMVSGVIQEVKMGYRENVKSEGTKGYADDLGGVYSNFLNGDEFAFATWAPKLLVDRPVMKRKIEGLSDAPAILRATPSRRNAKWRGNRRIVNCEYAILLDDLLAGELHTPPVSAECIAHASRSASYQRYRGTVEACRACRFGALRTRAVPLAEGRWKAVVLAEAPGREEDACGSPLVGDSGDILWAELAKWCVSREDVCISNVLKCRPPDNKYDKECGAVCADLWLKRELLALRPVVMLVLGSNAAHWVDPSDERNVSERAGTSKWSDTHGCWVVYGPHPASLLYAKREGPEAFKIRSEQIGGACERFASILRVCNGSLKTEASL